MKIAWCDNRLLQVAAITVNSTKCIDVISVPYGVMWHTYTANTIGNREIGDIFYARANISVLAARYGCLKGSVLRASSTQRWQGYECLAQINICIAILLIWFSSGCYCVPFYKAVRKSNRLFLQSPGLYFFLFRILVHEPEPSSPRSSYWL